MKAPGASRRLGRLLGKSLRVAFCIWLATLAAVTAVSILWPRDAALPAPADAILCLGAGMSPDLGWQAPDAAARGRALTCAALQTAGLAPRVIFTGYGHDRFSSAAAMAQVAQAAGLPPEAAILEENARSTLQNAAFALPLLPADTTRIVLVTDAFHLPRAALIFRLLGAPEMALYAASFPTATRHDRPEWAWILRETAAIWVNVARIAAYQIAGLMGVDDATRIGWMT